MDWTKLFSGVDIVSWTSGAGFVAISMFMVIKKVTPLLNRENGSNIKSHTHYGEFVSKDVCSVIHQEANRRFDEICVAMEKMDAKQEKRFTELHEGNLLILQELRK